MKISRILTLFKKTKPSHIIRAEDWVIDPDWSKWRSTHVKIPWEIHRNRSVKCFNIVTPSADFGDLVELAPYKFATDYDEDENLVVKYSETNYPMEPRQEITIQF